MSPKKYSLRSKPLDKNEKLPIYQECELPANIYFVGRNRSVSQMPTGMEKEEESEHHIQKAMSNQNQHDDKRKTVIPTPDTNTIDDEKYNRLYKDSCGLPDDYYRATKFNVSGTPDYDLDSEDEKFYLSLKEQGAHSKVVAEPEDVVASTADQPGYSRDAGHSKVVAALLQEPEDPAQSEEVTANANVYKNITFFNFN